MSFFDEFIVRPILNLLMAIYSIIPDFGVSIIIFTIIVRLLLWPLIKKQLHQAKAMRKMQPELVKIKKQYAKNPQMRNLAMMELYKKHNISAFGSIGVMIIQFPILIAMYRVVQIFVSSRTDLGKYVYDFMKNLPVANNLVNNPDQFNQNFLGIIDLTQHAISKSGIVFGLVVLAAVAAYLQYLTSKQLSPQSDSNRKLRDILAEAGDGKEADQTEVNAIMTRKMMKFMPVMMFFIIVYLPAALALYLTTASAVGYLQNYIIFKQDSKEMQVSVKIEDGIVVASIPHSERSSILIGRNAETLRSIQNLLSTALRHKEASTVRVNLDIADYKKQHAEKIAEKARGWIEEVRRTGESKVVDLNAADRWTVHHLAGEYSDIDTHSEGEGRERRLIISQKSS